MEGADLLCDVRGEPGVGEGLQVGALGVGFAFAVPYGERVVAELVQPQQLAVGEAVVGGQFDGEWLGAQGQRLQPVGSEGGVEDPEVEAPGAQVGDRLGADGLADLELDARVLLAGRAHELGEQVEHGAADHAEPNRALVAAGHAPDELGGLGRLLEGSLALAEATRRFDGRGRLIADDDRAALPGVTAGLVELAS